MHLPRDIQVKETSLINLPHLVGNEQVENSDDDERHQVARQKDDSKSEGATMSGRTPLGVAGDVVEPGDVVVLLTVDDHPRCEHANRYRPD